MGGRTSRLTGSTSEGIKQRFETDMKVIRIASIVAIIIAVVIPLLTLSWITMLCHIPLALIVYDIHQLASTAQQHGGEKEGKIKPLIAQNTLLLNVVFKIFPTFADKARTVLAQEIHNMTGIRGRCSSSEKN